MYAPAFGIVLINVFGILWRILHTYLFLVISVIFNMLKHSIVSYLDMLVMFERILATVGKHDSKNR